MTDKGETNIKLKPAVSNLVQISKCLNTSFSRHETMTKYHNTFKPVSGNYKESTLLCLVEAN